MKPLLIVIALLALAAVAGDVPHVVEHPGSLVGRFQLLSGPVEFISGRGTAMPPMHFILRLDTQTGQTWSLDVGTDKDGQHRERWLPLDEMEK